MKRPVKTERKHFKVSFEIAGSMIDVDTPLSEQAITDMIEMQFSLRQDCRVLKLAVEEVKANP